MTCMYLVIFGCWDYLRYFLTSSSQSTRQQKALSWETNKHRPSHVICFFKNISFQFVLQFKTVVWFLFDKEDNWICLWIWWHYWTLVDVTTIQADANPPNGRGQIRQSPLGAPACQSNLFTDLPTTDIQEMRKVNATDVEHTQFVQTFMTK